MKRLLPQNKTKQKKKQKIKQNKAKTDTRIKERGGLLLDLYIIFATLLRVDYIFYYVRINLVEFKNEES